MQDDRERDEPAGSADPPASDPEPSSGGGGESDVPSMGEEIAEEFETAPAASRPAAPEPEPADSETATSTTAEQAAAVREPAPAPEPEAVEPEPQAVEPDSAAAAPGPAATETPEWPAADSEPMAATSEVPAPHPPTGEPAAWPEEPAALPPGEAEAYPARPPAPEPPTSEAAHSVPATQVGESTLCPRCGTENRPGIAFCRNCGQRLVAAGVPTTVERPGAPEGTQQCPRCGTHNRAGVAFCQNCGANLRVSATPVPGYVPPAVPAAAGGAAARPAARGGAVLGPIVLLVGAIGIATAWLLPFPYGAGSLWERSFGSPGGYGIGFWDGYSAVGGGLLDQAYFGFAAAAPILAVLLVVLAVAGFLRAAPGSMQVGGLVIGILWALGLAATFLVLEVGGNWNGSIIDLLRALTPAGIIFLLASLIVVIGAITRLARS